MLPFPINLAVAFIAFCLLLEGYRKARDWWHSRGADHIMPDPTSNDVPAYEAPQVPPQPTQAHLEGWSGVPWAADAHDEPHPPLVPEVLTADGWAQPPADPSSDETWAGWESPPADEHVQPPPPLTRRDRRRGPGAVPPTYPQQGDWSPPTGYGSGSWQGPPPQPPRRRR